MRWPWLSTSRFFHCCPLLDLGVWDLYISSLSISSCSQVSQTHVPLRPTQSSPPLPQTMPEEPAGQELPLGLRLRLRLLH